jgi:hypothetical protein
MLRLGHHRKRGLISAAGARLRFVPCASVATNLRTFVGRESGRRVEAFGSPMSGEGMDTRTARPTKNSAPHTVIVRRGRED